LHRQIDSHELERKEQGGAFMASVNARRAPAVRNPQAASIARGLGWFSVALGVAQLLAPRTVCRLAGLPYAPTLTRLCGARELACGIGILTQADPEPYLKARVAGDAMDLACLAGAMPLRDADAGRLAVSMGAAAGITALDVYCAHELADTRKPSPIHVRTTVAVNRPPEELYRFWRNLENLPRIMPHLKSVSVTHGNRSHWVAKGPGGIPVDWDAELIDDRPDRCLAWRSHEDAEVYNAGSVQFEPAPGGGGTFVTVELLYDPPAGSLGAVIAKLFGRDAGEVRADLGAFRQLMETGESPPGAGRPAGRG
jgi:uncharacterized membrane protein